MKKTALSFVIVIALAVAGCEGGAVSSNKQTFGTGIGALAGGLAGSQVGGGSGRLWATGAGVLLGALVGSEVGASLDRADRTYMTQAQRRTYNAPIGERIYWSNPESGNSGYYTPVRDGTTASGDYCREYQQTVVVGGRSQRGYGTACRRPDGSWEIMG